MKKEPLLSIIRSIPALNSTLSSTRSFNNQALIPFLSRLNLVSILTLKVNSILLLYRPCLCLP
jgi:hypothetical protein